MFMDSSKIDGFYNDFWFVRLNDLLKENVGKSRQDYIKVCAYWYILIEVEGYTEKQIMDELAQDGFKMNEIKEKWNVDSIAGFIERVHYIASAKQINHFVKIIKQSSATNEVKDEIIRTLMNEDIIETWNNDDISNKGANN